MVLLLSKQSIRQLDKSIHKWETIYTDPKLPRYACLLQLPDCILIMGGKRSSCSNKVLKLKSQELTQCTPMISSRAQCSAILYEKTVFVIGGNNTDSFQALSTCEAFSLETELWEQMPAMSFPKIKPSLCINNGWVYAVGGIGTEIIERFNINSSYWDICELRLFQPASLVGLISLEDDQILILGGKDERKQDLLEVWLYDFAKMSMIRQQSLYSPCAIIGCYLIQQIIYIATKTSVSEYQLIAKEIPSNSHKMDNNICYSIENGYVSRNIKSKIAKNPNVLVIKRSAYEPALDNVYVACIEFLIENMCQVYVEKNYHSHNSINVFTQESRKFIDLIVVMGGDGTVIWATKLFCEGAVPPIVAFNFGSLGFMTKFPSTNIIETLSQILNSDSVNLEMHSMINFTIKDGPTVLHGNCLNEICVDRGANGNVLELEVYLNGEYCTTSIGDGLLIATPCGSTAYSLSAGGSIVHNTIPAILITPICPHSLSFRPLIVPDSVEVTVKLPENARISGWVNIDGATKHKLGFGASINIKLCEFCVPYVILDDGYSSWVSRLRDILGWNDRKRQKALLTKSSL